MIGYSARRPLWQMGDFALLYSLNLLALSLLLGSAWATSEADHLSGRIGWMTLGVISTIVGGTGNAFWLLAGRRAIGERRVRLLGSAGPAVDSSGSGTDIAISHELVALEGSRLFHRADCPLVKGKPVGPVSRARRRPCGVCQL